MKEASNKKKVSRGQLAGEESFHDKRFRGERLVIGLFERLTVSLYPAMPSNTDKLLSKLGDVNDKYICEMGCGTGTLTFKLATRGARVSAIDISTEAIALAQDRNRQFIPKQIDIRQMNACHLMYDDNSFDLVIGISILHHIDIVMAAVEISRVLKPGGRAVFIEPLAHNPLSNIWRRFTPSIRTASERPLSYAEIRAMGKFFKSTCYEEYALLSLLSSLVYLVTHSKKVKERSAELLLKIEPLFLKWVKPLRKYSGAILIEFTK